jgi:MFS family permease
MYGDMPRDNFMYGVSNSLIIGIMAALSHGLKDRWELRWIDTLIVGLLGGLGGGVLSGIIVIIGVLLLNWSSEGWGNWFFVWFWGGLGVGGTAGIIAGLLRMRCEPTITEEEARPGLRGEGRPEFMLRLHRVLRRGGKAALMVGLLLSVLDVM